MLLHGSSSAFTGCASQSASPSNWHPGIPINPQHFTQLPTVVFHPCHRNDIKTTAAGLLPLIIQKYRPFDSLQSANGHSQLPALVLLQLSQLRFLSRYFSIIVLYLHRDISCACGQHQHMERPFVPHHICTVTCGLQTVLQDFPLLSFLPGHPDMTYLSSLIIIIVFSGISRGPSNN